MHLSLVSDAELALAVTVLAGVVANVGSLYAAVLSGLHRSYLAQMGETVGAILQFVGCGKFYPVWPATGGSGSRPPRGETHQSCHRGFRYPRACKGVLGNPTRSLHIGRFLELLGEAKGFILLDTGNVLSEAMVRILLVVMAGPSELGLYDIANRLPVLIRNAFTYGLLAIFPAIAALQSPEKQSGYRAGPAHVTLGCGATGYCTSGGLHAAGKAVAVSCGWAGLGAQVSTVTLVTSPFGGSLTAYNIPFYLTIQAIGLESVVARNSWVAHSVDWTWQLNPSRRNPRAPCPLAGLC